VNEDLKYCGRCGTSNLKDAVFCERCGNRFIEPPPAETVSPPPSAAPVSYTPPPYAPVSEPSSPPPRKFKKEYVIAAVAILAVLLIVGATAMAMSNNSSPSASPEPSNAYAYPSGYWSSPTLSVTPIPTLKPLPANAVIKRGTLSDTLSQGGVTATLVSYVTHAPGYVSTTGMVWNNTSYNATVEMNKPAQYFSPSSKPQDGFVWSDNYSSFGNMIPLSQGDNSNSIYSAEHITSRAGTTAYPVEYRIMLPTEDNSATYVFIWSL